MTRGTLTNTFFFTLLVIFLVLGATLLAPFGGALLSAAVLAVVFYPLHRWVGKRFKKSSPTVQALCSDLLIFFFFVIPLAALLWAVVDQSLSVVPYVKEGSVRLHAMARRGPLEAFPLLQRLPASITRQFDMRSTQVKERLTGLARRTLEIMAKVGTATVLGSFDFLINLFLMLFALFFFFRDGPAMVRQWNELLPLPEEGKRKIDKTIHNTIIGVVRGTFITSLAQGTVATIGYVIVGNDAALLLGFLTFVATIIPSVGTALVWGPLMIYYFAVGPIWKGFFLLIWGALVIGTIDNVIRPLVVGKDAEMPFFWLFFAILGGLQLFGMSGLLLGPLIFALIPVLLDIYRAHYLRAPNSD